MTEKQRWLLRDLDQWRDKQIERVGSYRPKTEAKDPPHVRAAKLAGKRAADVLQKWEKVKTAPWKKEKDAIYAKHQAIKRVILFEKTETALKAIKSLVARPGRNHPAAADRKPT